MQATVRGNHLEPGAQPQMKGVAQHDARAARRQITRQHRFYRAIGAHRHEYRGVDHAMGVGQAAAARLAIGGEQFKGHQAGSNGARG